MLPYSHKPTPLGELPTPPLPEVHPEGTRLYFVSDNGAADVDDANASQRGPLTDEEWKELGERSTLAFKRFGESTIAMGKAFHKLATTVSAVPDPYWTEVDPWR